MRIIALSSLLALGMGGVGCRLPYCLEEVERNRDYLVHFGSRMEDASRWNRRAVISDAPASVSCKNMDALGQGISLQVRLEDAVVPGTVGCDGSRMTLASDAGIALGAFTGGTHEAFASARFAVGLSEACRGEWALSLFPVDGADPFAAPATDGRPGLIIERSFVPTQLGCAPQFLPEGTTCWDHWSGRLEQL